MSTSLVSRSNRHAVRPAAFAAVAALVLAAAWSTAAPGDVADAASPKIRALDVAAVFPDSTLALIHVDGRPCAQHAKELGVSRILRSPEMQEFLGPLMQIVEGQIQGAMAAPDAPFDVQELVSLLLTGRTMVGLTRLDTQTVNKGDFQSKQTSVDLMFALNFASGRQESMRKIVTGIEEAIAAEANGPPSTAVQVGGIEGRRFPLLEGESFRPFSSLTYLLVDDWLLAGTSEAQLEQAIGRIKTGDAKGSLAANDVYRKCAAETLRPKSIAGVYLGLKDALHRVEKLEHGPEIVKQLKGSGIEQMTALAFATEMDGLAMRDRGYVHGYNPSGLVEKPQLAALHALLPKSSSLVVTTAFDPTKMLDIMLAAFASEMGDRPAREIAAFEKKHKIRLREDVLGAIGPEFGFYASLPRHGVIPEFGFLMRTTDKPKAENVFKKLVALGKLEASAATTTHRGAQINYVEIAGPGVRIDGERVAFRPCYTFVDGYVLVSPWPQAAKNFLDAVARKDGGFAARDDVTAAFARLRADRPDAGMGGMTYFDLPALAGFVLDVGVPALQSMVSSDMVQNLVDMAKFPPTDVFTSNLSPIIMTTQYDGEGVSTFVVSPLGMMSLSAVLSGAVVGIAAQRGMMVPGETHVIEVDPKPAGEDAGGMGGGEDDEDK